MKDPKHVMLLNLLLIGPFHKETCPALVAFGGSSSKGVKRDARADQSILKS